MRFFHDIRAGALTSLTVFVLLTPAWAMAQAIGGTVTDTTGAVLPGVTVEVRSPVLIERVRTAVTDGAGEYLITGLLSGVYTVTCTLDGFRVVEREGVPAERGVHGAGRRGARRWSARRAGHGDDGLTGRGCAGRHPAAVDEPRGHRYHPER